MKACFLNLTMVAVAFFVSGCSSAPEPTPEEELAAAREEFDAARIDFEWVQIESEKIQAAAMQRVFDGWMRTIKGTTNPQLSQIIINPSAHRYSQQEESMLMEFLGVISDKKSNWSIRVQEYTDEGLDEIGAKRISDRFLKAKNRLAEAEDAMADTI